MISGRCNSSSIARCISELSKKQWSAGTQGYRKKYLTKSALPSVECDMKKLCQSVPILSTSARTASTSRQDSEKETDQPEVKKNRLRLEKSPYLLEHATNPVDWYPWGDEALEKAKKENKLIFVSIGYSTCHWCHVMEKESFKNEEVAKIMNENYVNIKVDREERPDIDMMCMMFIQRLRGHGGWPLSVFLTPDLMPLTGGTYFSSAMFTLYLTRIAKEWTEEKNKMVKSATTIAERLKELASSRHDVKDDGVPAIDCAFLCAHVLMNIYDKEYGGFGSSSATNPNSPKFPEPCNLNFLLSMHVLSTSAMLVEMSLDATLNTLRKMAYGGIHDHIGKGFHRYTVDARWRVPHFEKMLYDQALLIQCYADAYIITKDTFFSDIVDDIAVYVLRMLQHMEGGFFSAEDADSLPKSDAPAKREGAFYVWTYDSLKTLLKKKVPGKDNVRYFDLICRQFSVRKEGNVESPQDPHGELTGKNVFWMESGIEDTANHFKLSVEDTQKYINEACTILFFDRTNRPWPSLDDKIVTAWNGLMISGLARAGIAVKNKKYVEAATEAATFVERYLFDKKKRILLRSCYRSRTDDKIIQRSAPIPGFHEDYAFLVKGLLDLYEATFDPHWIEFAEELQDTQDRLFWDSEDGGYFAMAEESSILTRMKDSDDGAQPSSNSIACSNMLRLAIYLDRDDLRNKAEKLLCAFGNKLVSCPAACPQMMLSLIEYHHPTQIYVTGKTDAKETIEMLDIIRERLMPGRVLILADAEQSDNILFRRNMIVKRMKPQKNRATAFICRDYSCSLPISNTSLLISELDKKVFTDL
ncbi:spermatogenesis-associated protein 20 [Temnothorax curvispinosus]|uniref:Spermatogenesis-associated protein 20 n=1 Tax=Temnothorax curvispinosus TaxID=300111 RepID=A0A6J1RDX8_9HYME|nr:spermatogenesis-associated protein 20 [Temnothorax curvispinosus]XP_024891072.1 spermatogenesis-associated protein 20 [Temnothorax curvispinosus]XP_024891074.1 spermatogenesis-associated protein 20 [Temnothorax curvispinosus]